MPPARGGGRGVAGAVRWLCGVPNVAVGIPDFAALHPGYARSLARKSVAVVSGASCGSTVALPASAQPTGGTVGVVRLFGCGCRADRLLRFLRQRNLRVGRPALFASLAVGVVPTGCCASCVSATYGWDGRRCSPTWLWASCRTVVALPLSAQPTAPRSTGT